MSDSTPASEDHQPLTETHPTEIATITTADPAHAPAREKLHAKRVMKQGMDAFFSGRKHNPYAPASDDAELWSFGFNLSKDNWNDVRNPPPDLTAAGS